MINSKSEKSLWKNSTNLWIPFFEHERVAFPPTTMGNWVIAENPLWYDSGSSVHSEAIGRHFGHSSGDTNSNSVFGLSVVSESSSSVLFPNFFKIKTKHAK